MSAVFDPEFVIPRGKYKDRTVEEVPSDYLRYIAENWDDDDSVLAARGELQYRDDHSAHFYD